MNIVGMETGVVRQTARLEFWTLHEGFWGASHLCGYVYDHPQFADGTFVTTSLVRSVEGNSAETVNTDYVLGKPA